MMNSNILNSYITISVALSLIGVIGLLVFLVLIDWTDKSNRR